MINFSKNTEKQKKECAYNMNLQLFFYKCQRIASFYKNFTHFIFLILGQIKKTAIADSPYNMFSKVSVIYLKSASVTPSLTFTSEAINTISIPTFITILYGIFTPLTSL